MTTPSTNIVTQALANVIATAQSVSAVSGLPPPVAAVQGQALAIADKVVPTVQTLRQQVQQFVQKASPLVASALAALGGPNPASAAAPIASVQDAAITMSGAAAGSSQQLGTARDGCNACVANMSGAYAALSGQIAAAQAQAASDQSEVDSLNKTKLYWLALGPFGLIGLGVAIGELVTANQKVSGIQAEISALNQQAAQAAKMQIDVQQLSTDVSALATRLQDLQNAVDFVCSDLKLVTQDLGNAANAGAAKVYLVTVQSELALLASETSG